ncbi:3-phenylpropionate/trans-cinnamate dioxygenase ferredoxin reductase subunit [Monaibacterium marinum]|uniref:3-phenylpropionate/trans-cinnamate dioxygenase ferredoxin reductase subunit n=1 Tax=Pontivivens marinum TaxID=1690039 RepID=A0A2C9CNC1_9RHOB|nr:FAD/NAD(P)-binding oxidoreductase [Monaibacterium marinum]SOH92814.1 3-phenylpropionate/trans-cinnamate dioxygenase ferredoxin reductase subunit [Monaibacterium marinum]
MNGHIVIGAGQAGAALVAKLRQADPDTPITLIGEEPVPPYQRPPLSKKYLMGEMELERLYLRPESFYTDQRITLRLGTRVASIDRQAKVVVLHDGERLPYDTLALTTGSTPRMLPAAIGGALRGVYPVRSLAHIDLMAGDFAPDTRCLIVGGGYIGLEAAAVAASRGLKVVLVEAMDRILQRVASAETSDYFRALHSSHGVDIREGTGLERLTGDTRVSGAVLTDGTTLDVDFVIVGIGIAPDITLAEEAGLQIENGIRVDARSCTSDPSIFAAGDCASFPHGATRIRLESVPNAIEQADVAALNMAGQQADYGAKPWFWSDQYDVKLQIAGLNTGYDRAIVRAGARAGTQSVWYFCGADLLAVDAMNDPRAYMIGKRMIEAGKSPPLDAVADPETDLKSLMA